MYPIKSYTEINQLQLHIQNLHLEAKMCIGQQNQVNQKMYSYNFEKVSLKLHKFTIEFMAHLAVSEKIYSALDEIRATFGILNKTAKDRKARSSRTYVGEDHFGLFANNPLEDKSFQEKEELDLIEQFMIKRNHEIQSNVFGDVDDVFKNRQRRGLEDFLSHANNQARNLQNHLKSASVQRNVICSTKLGGLSKRYLVKSQTFDLQRIDELDIENRYHQDMSRQSSIQEVGKVDQEIQTVLSSDNIRWSKLLTYCTRNPQYGEEIQFDDKFDTQIYGEYEKGMLQAMQSQTEPMGQEEPQTPVVVVKSNAKKAATKVHNKPSYKPSNLKSSKSTLKQANTQSVYAKEDEKEESFILNTFSTKECQQSKKFVSLQVESNTVNEFVVPHKPLLTTQNGVIEITISARRTQKAIEPKEMVFELKAKKQLSRSKRFEAEESFRGHKKNYTTIGHVRPAQKTVDDERHTEKQIALDNRKAVLLTNKSKDSFQDKVQSKQDSLKRRRNDKKFTWKDSFNSSFTNAKSTVKIHDFKEENTFNNEELEGTKFEGWNTNMIEGEEDQLRRATNSKTSYFKELHYRISPDETENLQKKQILKQSNTFGQTILVGELRSHIKIQLSGNGNDPNLIKQEEFEASCRSTNEHFPCGNAAKDLPKQVNPSKGTQTSVPNTQTKRTEDVLQSKYDQHFQKKHLQTTGVLYKRPPKPNESDDPSQISKNNTQKRSHTHVRVRTIGKDDEQKGKETTRVKRNSVTFHNSSVKNKIIMFNKSIKKHTKNMSQELPNLSGCKQKLSDLKKNFFRDIFKNSGLVRDLSLKASSLTKNLLLQSSPQKYDQESKIRAPIIQEASILEQQKQNATQGKLQAPRLNPYQKATAANGGNNNNQLKRLQQVQPKVSTSEPSDQTRIIKTIRRLLMTNSYRDKLLVYLSMVQVTHEKYCGKNCEHVGKFMREVMGGGELGEESVARQVLRMFGNRSVNFADVTNLG